MNSLSTFTFHNSCQIRTVLIDGNPWFVAKDICDALSVKNPSQSMQSLDDDERSMFNIGRSKTNGGGGLVNIINESGMYALVMRSRDAMKEGTPQHSFRKWVTSEVLPSIRKTGKYEFSPPVAENKPVVIKSKPVRKVPTANTIDLDNPEQLRRALLTYTNRVINLEEKVGQLQAVEKKLDKISNMEGLMLMSDMAKLLQEKPHEFMHRLAEMKWIFRRSAKAPWSASQQMILLGLLEQKMDMITHANGQVVVTHQVLVTAKGIRKLLDIDNSRKMNKQNNMLY